MTGLPDHTSRWWSQRATLATGNASARRGKPAARTRSTASVAAAWARRRQQPCPGQMTLDLQPLVFEWEQR